MALENLEKKLYGKKQEIETNKTKEAEHPEYEKTFLGKSWEEENNPPADGEIKTPEKPEFLSKFSQKTLLKSVIGTTIFFAILGMAFAGFYLYSRISANQNVNFDVFTPKNAIIGAPFNLKFNLLNNSKNALKSAEISIFLPENAIAAENEKNKRVFTKIIGDLEPNAGLNGEIPLVIFGNNETIKNFSVSINYISGQNKFEKKQNIEIVAKESAIKLDLTAPEKIINNENFEIIAQYSNISEYNFKKIRISFDYPKNFNLKKTDPIFQNGYLEIELPKNKEGKILISGSGQTTFANQEQSFLEIKSKIEVLYNGIWNRINEQSVKINFTPPPLSLKIESSASDYAFPNDSLTYRLIYYNNSDIVLSDAIIKAKPTGEMFDFSTLKTDGYYDSKNNAISWNASIDSRLKSINPKSGGSVEFSIKLKSYYPIRKISDKNFMIFADAEISSPTIPYNVAIDKTIGLAKLETKIGGQVAIESTAYFREPKTEIYNKGFLPPKADFPTNFTIHLTIKNYSNDIKNVSVKTVLSPGVKFTGAAKSNISSMPVYNERTGEISWLIDKIPATKGIISKPPAETIFQIELTPNTVMIQNSAPLIRETSITAIDDFIGKEIKNSAGALTTVDLSDWGFDSKNGLVIE